MISVSSLLNGNFDDYSKLFIEIPLLTYQKGLHMSPGGRYLRAFHKGNLDRMPKRYEEIFAFAEKNNLTLCGFSYEMGINENVIDRIEDYMPSPLNGYTHLLFNGDYLCIKNFYLPFLADKSIIDFLLILLISFNICRVPGLLLCDFLSFSSSDSVSTISSTPLSE